MRKPSSKPSDADSPEYLDDWASRLAKALSRAELASLTKDYGRLARDTRSTPDNRAFARQRAKAIQKFM